MMIMAEWYLESIQVAVYMHSWRNLAWDNFNGGNHLEISTVALV